MIGQQTEQTAEMFKLIKERCGIASNITIYDSDVEMYIADCRNDMLASGVSENLATSEIHPGVLTALALYVKAYIGNDREDSEKYLKLYRDKVFRLSLEGGDGGCGSGASNS